MKEVSFIVREPWIIGFSHTQNTLSAYNMKSQQLESIKEFSETTEIMNLQQKESLVFVLTKDGEDTSLLCWATTNNQLFSVIVPQLPNKFIKSKIGLNMVLSDINHFLFLNDRGHLTSQLIPKSKKQKRPEGKSLTPQPPRRGLSLQRRNSLQKIVTGTLNILFPGKRK